mmetsp:Transcript_32631/g.64692  ORF Transcript_32631/g.64692 Transcript_32631/m.64692 type:complete len:106 (+) Transcript_32631:1808-2125(+)
MLLFFMFRLFLFCLFFLPTYLASGGPPFLRSEFSLFQLYFKKETERKRESKTKKERKKEPTNVEKGHTKIRRGRAEGKKCSRVKLFVFIPLEPKRDMNSKQRGER